MIRIVVGFASIFFVSACMEASESRANRGNTPGPVPNPIILAGDAGPGTIAANELRGDGLTVVTAFNGRAAGITAFCSGTADALALAPGQDWTSAERQRCRDLKDGWGWSALSTKRDIGLYVRFEFAQDLLDKTPTAL